MNPYLLTSIDKSPKVFRVMLTLLTGRLDERVDPDRFTPREVIAHLADWEPILRGRLEAGLRDDGTVVEVYDEGRRAEELAYGTWDVERSLARFAEERDRTAAIVRGLSPEDLEKRFTHPERGPRTVRDQVEMLFGHDMYHLEQLATYLNRHD